ncbi:hypothetical protein QTP86_013977, partial [Hemibagrus guttatus]
EKSNNPQQKVNKQMNQVELEEPEPTLPQLSTQVKEAMLPSDGLSNSRVSADQQNTPQSPAGLGTHQTEESDMERGKAEEKAVGLFIPKPMLCCEVEEGKVPHSLEMLYQTAQCNSASDCLLLVAHVLLLETGFLPQGCVRDGEMPSGWCTEGVLYRLQYSHPLCENSLVRVVAMLRGQTLVINATLKTTNAVELSWKLALKPDAYVTKEWAGGNAGVVYRDLQKLSLVLKDQLAYPLIATAREALGLPALFGLAVLPPELLLRIMRLLDVPSIGKLSKVCRRLHSVTQDASLWKHFVYRDFRVNFQADTEHRGTDWKENLALYEYRLLNL